MSWRFEPLPKNQTSYVEVTVTERRPDTSPIEKEDSVRSVALFRELRPEASQRFPIAIGGQQSADFLFQNDSATELVYGWLLSDLKRIGWAE